MGGAGERKHSGHVQRPWGGSVASTGNGRAAGGGQDDLGWPRTSRLQTVGTGSSHETNGCFTTRGFT